MEVSSPSACGALWEEVVRHFLVSFDQSRLILVRTVLEHDGSLSRNDIYFGDNHSFNSTIWDSVAASFTNRTIPLATAISVRAERFAAAAAVNPTFNLTASEVQFSGIESALYMTVFADPEIKSEARTEWVGVLFGEWMTIKPQELG